MKALPIAHCSQCKYLHRTPYPTSDSWERPEYWWCVHPDVEQVPAMNEPAEEARQSIIKSTHGPLRFIQGYVEWTDEKHIKIPGFCKLPEIPE